ncbi:Short-chain collagen C4 [Holothuria leucospilota]|uniref:Short-chain collagen C4 n=1 Tax=Holothuria leucospilota TaxID=206669 RepID=A0A9Q1BKZ3_HOLLE|nr:Short-chain collagen C4 [Holothuria leucospilota]
MLLHSIADLKEQVKLLQETVNEINPRHRPEDEANSETEQDTRNNEPAQSLTSEETGAKSPIRYNDGKKRIRRDSGQGYPGSGCPQSWTPYYRDGVAACPPCATGPPGPPGPPGSPGVPGPMGRDGRDGRDSISGFLKGDLEEEVTPTMPRQGSNNSGAIYTRWGHSSCPCTSELVYTGIAGGSFYTHKGSGSNYLCLPEEPIYDETESSAHGERGRVYGGEYQTRSDTLSPFRNLYQHDVPCAVCKATNRPSLLMIPARNVCPDEKWTKEYHGYLMSERSAHYRTEYVCVDSQPQAVPRTSDNNNGALFYLVEGICTEGGGLPCGPYINGYELTCVVCTV